MTQVVFDASHEQDTDRFGAALAQELPRGAVVALVGTLGAGKTRLVQAVGKTVGIDPREVVSPTFVLVHEYKVRSTAHRIRESSAPDHQTPDHQTPDHQTPDHQTPAFTIYHLDAYRIRDDDEFHELGPEEYFESDGWTFIEWADRVASCLPADYLQIDIEVIGPTQRRFTVTAIGKRLHTIIAALDMTLRLDANTTTSNASHPDVEP